MRSFIGLALAGVCAWVWADASFAGRSEIEDVVVTAGTEEPVLDAGTPTAAPTTLDPAVPTVTANSVEAVAGISELFTNLETLVADYNAGTVDCGAALGQCNQCMQTLDTQYLGCQAMPAWQDCRNQFVEFQSTLPCCQETVISDVLVSEQIIGETIIGEVAPLAPVPMDQCCLPPVDSYGFSGGACGGCGGGGGGGFGGGGGLLGPALGATALGLSLADDDDGGGGGGAYDGT